MNKQQTEQWHIVAGKLQALQLEVAKLEQLYRHDLPNWEMLRNFVARPLREVTDNLNSLD